ncbi:NAD(P)/FAD-dependent oxidoreductase [Micromonospora narathiwatensis]|uniref:Dehydrogenase (Flavoprotein) n=1 Tax=Micromonospora narathiwatensis TaxID=299146 RepID=A0A1A8ZHQ4_9ACTN|nr:NAD(P)/FAD-dependent oxidoreductase [Micromonospora narathiwatensis]SBT43400.1 Dehydrogenase (flavoprotein) [Micromonospora narathiwatensis]
MYDAIVVGARCAGATTAMLLARAGHRVLLLDRASFPSDTMSTHYVHPPTIARLAGWGLLDALRDSGCPPLRVSRWQLAGVPVTGCAPAIGAVRAGFGPRRFVLDTLLVRAAEAAGAELREECNVTDLLWDGDRVVGIRARGPHGEFTERARVVIGADGLDSVVAKKVQAPKYEAVPSLCCVYYTYWSGFTADYEVFVDHRRLVGAVPTNDGLVMVVVQAPREEFDEVRKDIEGSYLRSLALAAPSVLERVRAGRREERFVGTGRLPNFFRRGSGPGWALVGDAGYHKDSIGANGISDAIGHAALLTEHLHPALAGERPVDRALIDYTVRRDRESLPLYHFNLQAARLQPTDELLDVLRAIQGHQEQMDRFFGLIAGMYGWTEFVDGVTAALGTPVGSRAAG